jgi:hypothetical protein
MAETKKTVYVETTVPSYLTARPTADSIRAAHQQLTREWWQLAPPRFRLVVSDAVIAEISAGDPTAAAERLQAVNGLPILGFTEDVKSLVQAYDAAMLLPSNAKADLLYFAFAVAYRVDQLLTWNCTHIANPHVERKLTDLNNAMGRLTPIILTPEQSLAMM